MGSMDAVVPTTAVRSAHGVQHAGGVSSGAIRDYLAVAPAVAVPRQLALARASEARAW